ncbi:MAG: SDR family NAD(P)-dependent oxidoreductase [Ferrimicrobium sp.]
MRLTDTVAVVTGGASGLGYATAKALSEAGASVVIVDRNAEAGSEAAAALGASVHFHLGDVTDADSLSHAFIRAEALGQVRVAVSCAGIGIAERTLDRSGSPHSKESFERVIGVNLIGTFHLLRLGAASIAKSDAIDSQRGVIVNTASIAAFDGQIGQLAYAASKGGIVGMTLPAARDLAGVGIRVMAIAPGIMDTPLLGMLPEEVRSALGRSVPFPKRLGLPEDFAQLAMAIVANDYLNGEVIRIDGALRMAPK